jgi:uncharacterized membrane protein
MVPHTPLRPDAGAPESPPPPGRLTNRFDRTVDRLVTGFWSWGWLTLLVLVCPGLALWPLLHEEERGFVMANDLAVEQRHAIIKMMMGSALIIGCAYVGYFLFRRARGALGGFADAAQRINHFGFVVLSLPFLAALLHRGIEAKHEFITLTLIAIVTIVWGVFIYRLTGLRPEPEPQLREDMQLWRRMLPWAAVTAIFLFYGLSLSYFSLLDHRNLGTHIYDLGIYDNVFWRTSHGDFLGCSYCKAETHTSAHFDPIIAVLSPIYLVSPRAETILVLQSFWLGAGVFPLYLLAKHRLGNPWLGVVLGGMYVLYPALHGANMFDFHSLTMAIPLILWVIYFIDSGARWRYWLVLTLFLFTREDMALLACFFGAYAMMQRRPVTGLATIAVSLSWLAFVKLKMMTDPGLLMAGGKDSFSYIYFYEDMIPHEDEGLKGLVISLVTNPAFVLKVLVFEDKIFFFLALLLPLLFLPIISGKKSVIMVYGMIFIGLASRKHMFSLHFQYSAVFFPVLLASMPDAIDRAATGRIARALTLSRNRLRWTLVWTSFVATLLTSYKFGVFWGNDHFKAGWNRLVRNPKEDRQKKYDAVREMVERIGPDASVSSSSGLGPHVSNRRDVYKWPVAKDADFLLLGTANFDDKDVRRLERMLKKGEFRFVMEGEGIELFERVPEDEQEAAREAYREAEPVPRGKNKNKSKKARAPKGKTKLPARPDPRAPGDDGEPPMGEAGPVVDEEDEDDLEGENDDDPRAPANRGRAAPTPAADPEPDEIDGPDEDPRGGIQPADGE